MPSAGEPIFYIHIGLPKTATTTIQYFLTIHREALLKRGVLYPQSIAISDGHSELHRTLSVALEPERVPWLDGLRRQWGNADVIASLLEETLRSKPKVVILSAESLSFMLKPEALKQALAPYPVRILVYLRRQDSFLASFYNQLIKSRLYTATFEGFLQQSANGVIDLREYHLPLVMCRYDYLLNLWGQAFGRDNIFAGVYDDYDMPIGILHDIAIKTGIDISDLAPPHTDTNPALPPSLLYLKRSVNALLSTEQERVLSERIFTSSVDGCATTPSPRPETIEQNIARRQAILAPYRDGNSRAASEYFGDRPYLFRDPDQHDPLLPDVYESKRDLGQAAVNIIARLVMEASR
jgi:hypothetical protein